MDAYQEQLVRQNLQGLPCIYCGSFSGHLFLCKLINSTYAESQAKLEAEAHEFDASFLREVGIQWF